jgi:hypothetical protein
MHLVDYTGPNGNKYTICGHIYFGSISPQNEVVNLLALDNAVHNICRDCYSTYEAMVRWSDFRDVKSTLQNELTRNCKIQEQGGDLWTEYWYLEDRDDGPAKHMQKARKKNKKSRKRKNYLQFLPNVTSGK